MPSDSDLSKESQKNRDHRLKLLNLNNKILQAKHDYLVLLKQHYETYWLRMDLECYEAKMTCMVNKAKFLAHQAASENVNKLKDEIEQVDGEISQLTERLDKFKSLDPQLLAKFWALKDEIECQEMLIKISEDNISQDTNQTQY